MRRIAHTAYRRGPDILIRQADTCLNCGEAPSLKVGKQIKNPLHISKPMEGGQMK